MDADEIKSIEPACRLGPGGDFVFFWPLETEVYPAGLSRLGRIGVVLREALAVALGSGSAAPLREPTETADSAEKACKPKVAIVKGGRRIRLQPSLFTDDWAVIGGPSRKPKHRGQIRQRSVARRFACELAVQATLFEPDGSSAKTA